MMSLNMKALTGWVATFAACVAATSGCSSSSGASPGGGPDGSTACNPPCGTGRTCCGGQCVNTANDPLNCGGCRVTCSGATPFCDATCKPTPCTRDGGVCGAGSTCCGGQCCTSAQICCLPEGPLDMGPACETPTGSPPTCSQGCAPLCISDKNLKRDIQPVDESAVLEAVSQLPVSTWSYTYDDPSVRHMGPMAQDFYAQFGLGQTDRAYDAIDAHGVAFAAIRALYQRLQNQDARLYRLERENARLRAASRGCGR